MDKLKEKDAKDRAKNEQNAKKDEQNANNLKN